MSSSFVVFSGIGVPWVTGYVPGNLTGDVFDSVSTPGTLTVTGIQNFPIAVPTSAGFVYWTGSAWTYTGAPNYLAKFLELTSADATTPNARVLTAGSGIAFVDGGAGSTFTISSTSGAATTSKYALIAADAGLPNSRTLAAGTGMTLTDAGAGSTLTIATTITQGAPTTPTYAVLAASGSLPNSRTLTAGTGISLTDAGAGSTLTIANTVAAGAPTTPQYLLLAADGTLTNSRTLAAGTGISLTDAGAGSTLTVASTATGITISSGLSTSRPAANNTGNLYTCTDLPVQYLDGAGPAWKQIVLGQQMPAAAANGSYTTVGNISLANFADVLRASTTSNAASSSNCALIAGTVTNTATWVVNLVASLNTPIIAANPEIGVCVSNGTTSGTSVAYGPGVYNSSTGQWGMAAFNVTVGGARVSATPAYNLINQMVTGGSGLIRLRLLNDGLNLHYQASNDGFHWHDLHNLACPASLTNYGFWIGEDTTGSGYCQALVYRNDLTTLTVAQATVTAATNATPIVITTSASHNFESGDLVAVRGLVGNTGGNNTTGSEAVGTYAWPIKVVSATTFSLTGSVGNGVWTSGGVATLIGR